MKRGLRVVEDLAVLPCQSSDTRQADDTNLKVQAAYLFICIVNSCDHFLDNICRLKSALWVDYSHVKRLVGVFGYVPV